jgi:transposase-like protein
MFEDICDMHEKNGCWAEDEHFADRYNVHEETAARWRRELQKAGYLRTRSDGDKRYLEPNNKIVAEPQNRCQTAKTSQQKDGQATKSSQRNRCSQRLSNPAEARESAPAREDDLVRDSDPPAIEVFVEAVGRRPYPDEAAEIPTVVGDTMRRLRIFREQCQKARRNVGDPSRVRWGYLAEDFERAVQRSDPGGDGMPVRPFEDNTGEGYMSFCPEYQAN